MALINSAPAAGGGGSDIIVPEWALAETKPTYTYNEVGATPSSHATTNLTLLKLFTLNTPITVTSAANGQCLNSPYVYRWSDYTLSASDYLDYEYLQIQYSGSVTVSVPSSGFQINTYFGYGYPFGYLTIVSSSTSYGNMTRVIDSYPRAFSGTSSIASSTTSKTISKFNNQCATITNRAHSPAFVLPEDHYFQAKSYYPAVLDRSSAGAASDTSAFYYEDLDLIFIAPHYKSASSQSAKTVTFTPNLSIYVWGGKYPNNGHSTVIV